MAHNRTASGPRAAQAWTTSGPFPDRARTRSAPCTNCSRPRAGPHGTDGPSLPHTDEFAPEVIASHSGLAAQTEGMSPEQSEPPRLKPRRPPGRSDRKALAFASEIQRLRAEGHTHESIREALLAAGVPVSTSTVRRELTRPERVRRMRLAKLVPMESAESPPVAGLEELEPHAPALTAPVRPAVQASRLHRRTPIEPFDSRPASGLLPRIIGALGRLLPPWRSP